MTAVHHHQQGHPTGTPPGLQGFKGSTHRASGEDDIVDQDHLTPIEAHRQVRRLNQSRGHPIEIIPMKGGVEAAAINGVATTVLQTLGQHRGQGHTAGGDAKEHQVVAVGDTLKNLGSQAIDRAAQILG